MAMAALAPQCFTCGYGQAWTILSLYSVGSFKKGDDVHFCNWCAKKWKVNEGKHPYANAQWGKDRFQPFAAKLQTGDVDMHGLEVLH
jgi:hypothetical protein